LRIRIITVFNAICIKYGTLYGPEYVNRLYAGLRRNSAFDVRMFCMTDDSAGIDRKIKCIPLPQEPFHDRMFVAMQTAQKRGRLQKVSLFRPGLIPDLEGPMVVFDIDIVITGPVDELRDFAPGKVCMRREWSVTKGVPSLGHGSVERFDPTLHGYLYDFMAREPEAAVALGGGSEQSYTSLSAQKHGDFQAYPDQWIASFKRDCRPMRPLNLFVEPRLPSGAKVVCFHGNPKMSEAVDGYKAGPLHSTKPCGWLKEAWMGPLSSTRK
jgi:hypothetical protein